MLLVRKPLLFLLVLAVGASLAGGGRLSLRLLVDTATTLAVIPLIQVVALAVVYWTGRRELGFPRAVDAFFSGSRPWFAAVAALAAFGAAAPPPLAASWFGRLGAAAILAAAAASLTIDFAFFRSGLGRTPTRAAVDVAVQRAIGWTATLTYFIVAASPKLGSTLAAIGAGLFGDRA